MNLREKIEIQEKSMQILTDNNFGDIFRWISNFNIWIYYSENVKVTKKVGKKEDPMFDEFDYSFTFKKNKYRVCRQNVSTSYFEGGSYTSGDFILFFNDEKVFQTKTFDEGHKNWQLWWTVDKLREKPDGEISVKQGNIEICKLGEWVKDLPIFIESEKEKIKKEQEKEREEQKKSQREWEEEKLDEKNKNFDLGNYD